MATYKLTSWTVFWHRQPGYVSIHLDGYELKWFGIGATRYSDSTDIPLSDFPTIFGTTDVKPEKLVRYAMQASPIQWKGNPYWIDGSVHLM